MASKTMQGFVDALIIDLGRSILKDNQGKQQLLINKLWEKTNEFLPFLMHKKPVISTDITSVLLYYLKWRGIRLPLALWIIYLINLVYLPAWNIVLRWGPKDLVEKEIDYIP
jgi:hypothetical protein